MKFYYGQQSKKNLGSVCPELQVVFERALSLGLIDISVIQGGRGKAEQNIYFKLEKSRVEWPYSKHNKIPSQALDAAPYVNGKASADWRHCIYLAGLVTGIGASMGIKIRWGGNWDMDGEPITDQDFQDLWHYEVIR